MIRVELNPYTLPKLTHRLQSLKCDTSDCKEHLQFHLIVQRTANQMHFSKSYCNSERIAQKHHSSAPETVGKRDFQRVRKSSLVTFCSSISLF